MPLGEPHVSEADDRTQDLPSGYQCQIGKISEHETEAYSDHEWNQAERSPNESPFGPSDFPVVVFPDG